MQTFLPYADFEKSAKVLDSKRLGKQRVETLQILNVLVQLIEYPDSKPGWYHHPAVLMWKGYEWALLQYGLAICNEWILRGYKDTCYGKLLEIQKKLSTSKRYPKWLGNKSFHYSHRSNLLRKDKKHYRAYWPKMSSKLEYIWPQN